MPAAEPAAEVRFHCLWIFAQQPVRDLPRPVQELERRLVEGEDPGWRLRLVRGIGRELVELGEAAAQTCGPRS